MQDYGAPVGLRLAERHPDRASALIVQNANAYEEGITPDLRRIVLRLWTDRSVAAVAAIQPLFELAATRSHFLDGEPDPSLVSPDTWQVAQWGMERPGNKTIQFDLQANYGSNPERYPAWHRYFRDHQPPTLVIWGKGDKVFAPAGETAYRRDLRDIGNQPSRSPRHELGSHAPRRAFSRFGGHISADLCRIGHGSSAGAGAEDPRDGV